MTSIMDWSFSVPAIDWDSIFTMKIWSTVVVCLTVFFLFADQNLLAPNLSAVADDFHMNENEKDEKLGGYISIGFFIVGCPAALLVGYLTDTVQRTKLFGYVVLIGEIACIATYWVQTFNQLMVCRVLTGVSIGGALPIIFSMLGDLYPGEERVYVSTLVGIAFAGGISFGQLFAGTVGAENALGWRAPFILIAIPSLLCGATMYFTVDEPKRGDQEEGMRDIRERERRRQEMDEKRVKETRSVLAEGYSIYQHDANDTDRNKGDGTNFIKDTDGIMTLDLNDVNEVGGGRVSRKLPSIRIHLLPQPPSHLFQYAQACAESGSEKGTDSNPGSNPGSNRSSRSNSGDHSATAALVNKFIKPRNGENDRDSTYGEVDSPPTSYPSSSPFNSSSSSQHNTITASKQRQSEAGTGTDVSIDYSEKIEWSKVKILLSTPTAVLSYCQGIPGCLPWGMIYVFLNDYFSDDKGLSVQTATLIVTVFGIGGIFGQLFGGYAGQRLYNWQPKAQCILMGGSTIIGILPMIYLLVTKDLSAASMYPMALLAGFLVSITGPNIRAVLQNVCMPEIRGTAFAVFALTDDLGKGLGPFFVYFFITAFDGDRQSAYVTVVLMWLLCGVFLLAMVFTLEKDQAAVQAAVKKALLETGVGQDGGNGDPTDGDRGGNGGELVLNFSTKNVLHREVDEESAKGAHDRVYMSGGGGS